TIGGNDDEAGSSRSKRSRQFETVEEVLLPQVHHEFLLWEGCSRDAKSSYNTRLAQLLPRYIYSPCVVNWDVPNIMGCDGEIDDMLRIRLGLYQVDELDEEGFNVYFEGGLRSDEHFNAHETVGYDKIQKNDLWLLSMFDARHQNGYANVAWLIPRKSRVLTDDVDLYDRMGRMEIRQEAIDQIEYRHSYHWDRYQGVFEHMAGVYSVPLQGAYNLPSYAQS
ncbi:hypothetical protein Tco_1208380, partial [Tanacetum coccineum]